MMEDGTGNSPRKEMFPVKPCYGTLIIKFIAILFGLLYFLQAHGETLNGRVIKVLDGDTVTIVDSSSGQHRIKIMGIDAPDRYQAFGGRAHQNLSAMVFNREVEIELSMRDRTGLVFGKVMVAPQDSQCLQINCQKTVDTGLEQIKAGLAWWTRMKAQTAEDSAKYGQAEFSAKIHRIGLWSETNPVPPWKWPH